MLSYPTPAPPTPATQPVTDRFLLNESVAASDLSSAMMSSTSSEAQHTPFEQNNWNPFFADDGAGECPLYSIDGVLFDFMGMDTFLESASNNGDAGLFNPLNEGSSADPTLVSENTWTDRAWEGLCMSLSQIDPLESHCLALREILHQTTPTTQLGNIDWISASTIRVTLYLYFKRFQPHAPLLHLPTLRLSDCSPLLVLSMVLIGAMYTENAQFVRALVVPAYQYGMRMQKVDISTYSV